MMHLIAEGVEFDAAFRSRLSEHAKKSGGPDIWVCLRQWGPDNQRAAKSLKSDLGELLVCGELLLGPHAEQSLRDLAHYKQVQQILLDTARDPTATKMTRERASQILRFTKAVRGKQ